MKCIYKATNLVNGKIYIGQTNNLERRIREHRSHVTKDGGLFHEEICLFGFHNFQFDILEWCRSDEADEKERYYIAQMRKTLGSEMVYNYCDGGLGGQTHDVSGANNPCFGKVYSSEEREILSGKLKGRKKPEGFGKKLSLAMKGKPKSHEQVMKKSHPISVINEATGKILDFPSKAEMARVLHCDVYHMMKGAASRNGYRIITN